MPIRDDIYGGIVYSGSQGRMCPKCEKPVKECVCGRRGAPPPKDGVVRIARETKGRKGKGVTVITGAPLDAAGLKALAKELKGKCGSGGTVVKGTVEIQGDHREKIARLLEAKGWKVR